jgi:hypothetical protein
MTRFLGAQPKGIVVLAEHDLDGLYKVRKAMEMSNVNFNSEIEEEREAAEYFSKTFYNNICELIKFTEHSLGLQEG